MEQVRTTASSTSEGRLKADVAGKKKKKLKEIVGKHKMPNGMMMKDSEMKGMMKGKADKAMDAMKMAKYRFGGKGGKKC